MDGVAFSENHLSDSIVEFKAIQKRSLSARQVGLFSLLGIFLVFWWCIVVVNSWVSRSISIVALALCLYLLRNAISEESVMIIHSFGVQLRLKYCSGIEVTKFIDRDTLEGVLVHESIRGCRVRFDLAFLVRNKKRLVLCFKHIYPGLGNVNRVLAAVVPQVPERR